MKEICGVYIDNNNIVIQTGEEKDFMQRIECMKDSIMAQSSKQHKKVPEDVMTGMERFYSWKSQHYDPNARTNIPQEIQNELLPALYYCEKEQIDF